MYPKLVPVHVVCRRVLCCSRDLKVDSWEISLELKKRSKYVLVSSAVLEVRDYHSSERL